MTDKQKAINENPLPIVQKLVATVAAQPDVTRQTLNDVMAGIPARDAEIEALRAAQAQPSSDCAMLLKLMAAFDMEVWNCPNCTAAEETKDCDSAIMLREYLSNNPVIAQQPVSGADVTPQNVADALDLMDAILAPERGLLAVPYTSATVTAAREDLALIRAALARQEEKQ